MKVPENQNKKNWNEVRKVTWNREAEATARYQKKKSCDFAEQYSTNDRNPLGTWKWARLTIRMETITIWTNLKTWGRRMAQPSQTLFALVTQSLNLHVTVPLAHTNPKGVWCLSRFGQKRYWFWPFWSQTGYGFCTLVLNWKFFQEATT